MVKSKQSMYKEYCTGCGLCEACGKTSMYEDEKGYLHPENVDPEWMSNVCFCSEVTYKKLDHTSVWGSYVAMYKGWSNDNEIRTLASSGGIITSLACYLLEKKYVDEVIHVGKDSNNPTYTEVFFSKTKQEVIEHVGSRYSISHPLLVFDKLDYNKKYLFIGKPCDVSVLRNYEDVNPEIKKNIPYKFAFFCAGLPSKIAQSSLLERLGCTEGCSDLRYRGNGWPGYVTAIDSHGKSLKLEYEEAWGKILGRDIMKICRLCPDGIGEMADIACGDFWYLNEKQCPDFSEHEGRNVVFARSAEGHELLRRATEDGYICLDGEITERELYLTQKYQFIRKTTMLSKLFALILLGKVRPQYSLRNAIKMAKNSSLKILLRTFLGTIKRVSKGVFS